MIIITDSIIPVARLPLATLESLHESQMAIEERLLEISDTVLDLFCDEAELDRERSAYSDEDLYRSFNRIECERRELMHEAEALAYTLVHTLREFRTRGIGWIA